MKNNYKKKKKAGQVPEVSSALGTFSLPQPHFPSALRETEMQLQSTKRLGQNKKDTMKREGNIQVLQVTGAG